MQGTTSKMYPPELKERAVRMVAEIRAEDESEWAAMTRVSELKRPRSSAALRDSAWPGGHLRTVTLLVSAYYASRA